MNLLEKVVGIFDRIINYSAFFAGLLCGGCMLLVCYEVIMRYFFGMPVIWAIEVSEYILLYILFLGTAWLLKIHGHVNIDIMIDRVNPIIQNTFRLTSSLIGAISCSFLVVYGVLNAWGHFERGSMFMRTFQMPKWAVAVVIPFGGVLLVFQFLRNFFGLLNRFKASHGNKATVSEEEV